METAGRLRVADVSISIQDPRQAAKVEHDLVELLVVAVNAVLAGADTFVEIELWAREKLDWLRGYLRLTHGIASHDTFGRMFGLIDAEQFEAAFRRWVRQYSAHSGRGDCSRRWQDRGPQRCPEGTHFVAGVQDQPPFGRSGCHGAASGFGLCRRSGAGSRAASHSGKMQRNYSNSRVAFHSGHLAGVYCEA